MTLSTFVASAAALSALFPAQTSSTTQDLLPLDTQQAEDRLGNHESHHHGEGGSRPDDHAPIGVMQDHVHGKGEWMVSYRYMRMDMAGNRDGTDRVDDSAVVDPAGFGFMVAPTEMNMEMHMFGAMYAPSDTVTLAAMLPYMDVQMDHVTRGGQEFRTATSGVGDISVAALMTVHETDSSHLHLNLGVSAPTGSIDEEDETPASMGNEVQLPYPMQLGSGTWDVRPGLTWTGIEDSWSYGAQALGTLRMGRNSRDYSLGDRLDVTAWAAYRATQRVSFSGRLALGRLKNIDGADGDINAGMVPTADPGRRAGTRLDALVGLNALIGGGNRLSIEVGYPIHQDLNGPQLETDFVGTIGWQFSF